MVVTIHDLGMGSKAPLLEQSNRLIHLVGNQQVMKGIYLLQDGSIH